MSQCRLSGFDSVGTPIGKETNYGKNNAYITGSNKDVAIIIAHLRLDHSPSSSLDGPSCQRSLCHGVHPRLVSIYIWGPSVEWKSSMLRLLQRQVVTPEILADPEKAKEFSLITFILEYNPKEKRTQRWLLAQKLLMKSMASRNSALSDFATVSSSLAPRVRRSRSWSHLCKVLMWFRWKTCRLYLNCPPLSDPGWSQQRRRTSAGLRSSAR